MSKVKRWIFAILLLASVLLTYVVVTLNLPSSYKVVTLELSWESKREDFHEWLIKFKPEGHCAKLVKLGPKHYQLSLHAKNEQDGKNAIMNWANKFYASHPDTFRRGRETGIVLKLLMEPQTRDSTLRERLFHRDHSKDPKVEFDLDQALQRLEEVR